jgi:hypothetical protein
VGSACHVASDLTLLLMYLGQQIARQGRVVHRVMLVDWSIRSNP